MMVMIPHPLTEQTKLKGKYFFPINHDRDKMAICVLQIDRKTLEFKRGMPQRKGPGCGRPTHACAEALLWTVSKSKPVARQEYKVSHLSYEDPYIGPALRCQQLSSLYSPLHRKYVSQRNSERISMRPDIIYHTVCQGHCRKYAGT